MSAARPHATGVAPAPVTIAQGLLVVQAVLSTVGLLVAVYVVGLLMDLADRLATFASGLGGGTASPAADTSGLTVAVVLSLVEVVAVVAVSLWAFVAIGRRRGVARAVLGGLAAAQALLSAAAGVVAGAGPGFVALTVVIGLLVFDLPVLLLLTAPAAAGEWFRGAASAVPAVPSPVGIPAAPVPPAPAGIVPGPRPAPAPRPAAAPVVPTGRGPAAMAARPTGHTTPGGGFAVRVDARPGPARTPGPDVHRGGRPTAPGPR